MPTRKVADRLETFSYVGTNLQTEEYSFALLFVGALSFFAEKNEQVTGREKYATLGNIVFF